MSNREIFKIWAPTNSKWVDWVRPVLFVSINEGARTTGVYNFKIPTINYLENLPHDTAIIIDTPEESSVEEGIALAKLGFRPIPLYNGTIEQESSAAIVDNHIIQAALKWGAEELKSLKIKSNAPPAFLLDSNRMHRFRINSSIFDNSWDLYDQDLPSPKYFLKHNINKIIVKGNKVQKDLAKILYKIQKAGITIFITNGYNEIKEITIKKPNIVIDFLKK